MLSSDCNDTLKIGPTYFLLRKHGRVTSKIYMYKLMTIVKYCKIYRIEGALFLLLHHLNYKRKLAIKKNDALI